MKYTILGINTINSLMSLGVAYGDDVLGEISFHGKRGYLSKIHAHIDSLIQKCSISLQDLDAIACITGPGYFTSLRVGITSAKALAFALDKPIVSYNSFEYLKTRLTIPKSCVVIPSCSQKFFYCRYNSGIPKNKVALDYTEKILHLLDRDEYLVGYNIDSLEHNNIISLIPSGAALAKLGQKKYIQGIQTDPYNINPVYLRNSKAEETNERYDFGDRDIM